jgi:hypothetical protein
MNIKQHIEAGHYRSLTDHGNETVPTSDKYRDAYITDVGAKYICGWLDKWDYACTWDHNGRLVSNGIMSADDGACSPHLLPPAPRKVEVKAWGVFHGSTMQGAFGSEQLARNMARDWMANWKQKATVVELTGSYEEDWK